MNLFTVVIAEKEHIDSINEYKTFLKPFINEKQVVFCEWKPGETSLADAVPELVNSVSTKEKWRALVLCDNRGINKKNPFDLSEYKAPKPEYQTADMLDDDDDGEEYIHDSEKIEAMYSQETIRYLERVRKAKFAAFENAARQPLTRLMTYLCSQPTVTAGVNNASLDPEFAEYIAEMQQKKLLREKIINGEKINITLPTEVICVARRTNEGKEYDIRTSWQSHVDSQYTRFYDWNMYFDKMRYLIFDLLPENHRNYSYDYIRFLYAVMLVANNDIPGGAINPHRVYVLDCENDETALDNLLSMYDAKLDATSQMLKASIKAIEDKQQERLTDREAETIFCSKINVPVTINSNFNKSGLFADTKGVGLSTDCPEDEAEVWHDKYIESQKTLHKYLKQPKRSVKKAASDMKMLNRTESDKAKLLNDFQLEDLMEHIYDEELRMVNTETSNFYDIEKYSKRMEEEDKQIKKKISTRMSKKTTVILGAVILLLFLLGFVPAIIGNRAEESAATAVIVAITALIAMIIVAIICLFCLRKALVKLLKRFNCVMNGICGDVNDSLQRFSNYLSHACNVMRGYSVLNYREDNEDPDTMEIRVYQKHMYDIIRVREELREVFGQFMTGKVDGEKDIPVYDYDFTRTVDFTYPLPYSKGNERLIEFIHSGNYARVYVDFVKRVTMRREELYDE